MFTIQKIYKNYTKHNRDVIHVLDNINFSFPNKGLYFIVGRSGCGKTTLLNILGGLDTPDSGTIIVGDKKYNLLSEREKDNYRAKNVGFVFQDFNLIENLTVGENLKIAVEIQSEKNSDEITNRYLNELGIGDTYGHYPNELSGGQQQRVAIARTLCKNPNIILADEPTGNLDAKTAADIFEIFKNISKDKLVIIVSHDFSSAEQFADGILNLDDGKLTVERDFSASQDDASEPTQLQTEKKAKLSFKRHFSFALQNLRRKIVFLVIFIIVYVLAIVCGMYSQSLAEFKMYKNAVISMQENGVDKCEIFYASSYTEYTQHSYVEMFNAENYNRIKEMNGNNFLYRITNNGNNIVIETSADIAKLGFSIVDGSKELSDDGVYVTDVIYYNNYSQYYKKIEYGFEKIGETPYFGAIYSSNNDASFSMQIDGIIETGYLSEQKVLKQPENVSEANNRFFFAVLNSTYCTEKYIKNHYSTNEAVYIDTTKLSYNDIALEEGVKYQQASTMGFAVDKNGNLHSSDIKSFINDLDDSKIVVSLSLYNSLFCTDYATEDFFDLSEMTVDTDNIPPLGQTISLYMQSGDYIINREMTVEGIYFYGSSLINIDQPSFYANSSFAEEIKNCSLKTCGIVIQINDYNQLSDFIKSIESTQVDERESYYIFAPYAEQLYYYVRSNLSYTRDSFFATSMVLLFIAVCFFVYYLLGVIVGDTKTIGILRSMGTSKGEIILNYLCQGSIIAGIVMVLSIVATVITFHFANVSLGNEILKGTSIITLSPAIIVELIFLPIIVMVLAVVLPLAKLTRLQPIKIIKHL